MAGRLSRQVGRYTPARVAQADAAHPHYGKHTLISRPQGATYTTSAPVHADQLAGLRGAEIARLVRLTATTDTPTCLQEHQYRLGIVFFTTGSI